MTTKSKLALVVIDTRSLTYSRYIGTKRDRIVSSALMTESEVEHFRINPTDFIEIHCGPSAA